MLREDKYFQTLTEADLWRRYCGFLGLPLNEFMNIQKHLLMEEIELLAGSFLGRKIMKNGKPKSVEEFRQIVPLTTYADYEPYLSEQREDALAIKPYFWAHTSGRGGNFKWFPYSERAFETFVRYGLAAAILSSTNNKGPVNLVPGIRMLLNVGPRPYITGSMFYYLAKHFSLQTMPPLEQLEEMEFQEQVEKGFEMALKGHIDYIFSLSSILVKIGERMAGQTRGLKFSPSMLHPQVLFTLARAWLRSKREKRDILPKDLWASKGVITSGTDTAIYKDDIIRYWGSTPLETYSSTELVLSAMQSWDKGKGMFFIPDVAFWEFISEEERVKNLEDSNYQPPTVLLNEVEVGKRYEIILTHFYGMPLCRYRIGDLVKFVSLTDKETGINLPQMVFQTRVDGIIHLAALTELDEKTIWRAISQTGLKYEDWSAGKEYAENQTFLRLYIELREERKVEDVVRLVDEQLKVVDVSYRDLGNLLGLQPVKVTLLSPGTFQRYYEEKRKQGAHLSHLKPPHISPTGAVIQRLLELSKPSSG